jgi:hypothetical protein
MSTVDNIQYIDSASIKVAMLTGSLLGTSSYSTTASYAPSSPSVSASYSLSGSYSITSSCFNSPSASAAWQIYVDSGSGNLTFTYA